MLPAQRTGNEVLYAYNTMQLLRVVRRIKPDIIFVEQGEHALSYLQTIFVTKFVSPKSKLAFFSWINWKPKLSFKSKVFLGVTGWLCRKFSDGFIVGNKDAQELLTKKLSKVPNAVIPQLGVAPQDSLIPVEHRGKKILFIGRLMKAKGVFELLEAFLLLQNDFFEWQLHFVGSGPDKKELLKSAQKDDRNKVFFHDTVPHNEIFPIMKSASILVLPSRDTPEWREQFGHVLIEAMACGVAVIGGCGGAIPEVVGDAGIVLRRGDVSELKVSLRSLMSNDKLRKAFVEKGFDRVQALYAHEVIAEQISAFFKKLMS